ncbi:Threonine-phosphate decarboxylase [Moorella thermoacetica]|uniref:threonine-phosphate decarboxylase CobD n=1 Tax=Neomoorella thermoacetica TaxID=1525 RepID=UPI0030D4B821
MVHERASNSNGRELTGVIHGGDWQGAVDRYGWKVEEILDFSANINPLGPPVGVLETLKENLPAVQRYPDPASRRLKEALADQLHVDTGAIIIANGAVELIYLIMQVLKPDRVLVVEPTFGEYRRAATIAGAEVLPVYLDPATGFTFDFDRWRPELQRSQVAFICNPNNPTGRLLNPDILHRAASLCREQGVFLVMDESFLDFVPDGDKFSLVPQAAAGPGIFILHSLTKIFALPGLRLGYGVGCPDMVRRLENSRDPWSVNILAQMAGVAALADKEYLKKTRELIRREKEYLFHNLSGLAGFRPYYPEVNFILTNIQNGCLTVSRLAELLARKRILIRDCSSFPGLGPAYFRVAVRDHRANKRLVAALKEIMEES